MLRTAGPRGAHGAKLKNEPYGSITTGLLARRLARYARDERAGWYCQSVLLDEQRPRGAYASEPSLRPPQNVYYQRRLLVTAVAVTLVLLCVAVVNPGSTVPGKYPDASSVSSVRRSSAALVSGHPRMAREGRGGTPIAGTGSEGFPSDPN